MEHQSIITILCVKLDHSGNIRFSEEKAYKEAKHSPNLSRIIRRRERTAKDIPPNQNGELPPFQLGADMHAPFTNSVVRSLHDDISSLRVPEPSDGACVLPRSPIIPSLPGHIESIGLPPILSAPRICPPPKASIMRVSISILSFCAIASMNNFVGRPGTFGRLPRISGPFVLSSFVQ